MFLFFFWGWEFVCLLGYFGVCLGFFLLVLCFNMHTGINIIILAVSHKFTKSNPSESHGSLTVSV